MDNERLRVRYRCIGISQELQKAPDGSSRLVEVHSVTLVPAPEDSSFVNGTTLKLGLPVASGMVVGRSYDLVLADVAD